MILRCYYKLGLVDLHFKVLALFPNSTACPYEFAMHYNERHIASKLEGYLGQPTIICHVDDPCDYADSAYPEDMHSYWKFQRMVKILKRDDIYHNTEVLFINFDGENISPEMQKGFMEQLMRRYTLTG